MQKHRHMACKYQLNVTFIRHWINPCVWCPQSHPATHGHICKHTLNLCLSNIQFWVSISILSSEVHFWMHYANHIEFYINVCVGVREMHLIDIDIFNQCWSVEVALLWAVDSNGTDCNRWYINPTNHSFRSAITTMFSQDLLQID